MMGFARDSSFRVAAVGTAIVMVLLAGGAVADDDANIKDPWEGYNRGMFRVNEGFYRWVADPVAKGWDFIFPDPVERALGRFFDNIEFPIIFVNDVLQAKPLDAAVDVGRFVINTTIGLAGFFDPASEFGLEANDEDFGQTLGYWGVPTGPYLVLPIIGPSNVRDTFGLVADSASRVYPYFVVWWISGAVTGTEQIQRHSLRYEALDAERKSALDYYVFVRNAYSSLRENLVRDKEEEEAGESDGLYYPDSDGGSE